MFSAFLIKEQELSYLEKKHIKAALMQLARNFERKENQDNLKSKLIEKIYNSNEYCNLDDEELCDKMLEHYGYKSNDFNIHIFLEKKFITRALITNYCCFNIPTIEYFIYLRVEYISEELWTKNHCEKRFKDYKQALQNYLDLKNKCKNKTGRYILNHLTKKIDNHCNILIKRIKEFNCN